MGASNVDGNAAGGQTGESGGALHIDGLTFGTIIPVCRDHVLTITLNRPARKNAINGMMVDEMVYVLEYAKRTPDVRVVVIAAEGDVFCAGGDLKAMKGDASVPGEVSDVPVLAERPGESDEMVMRLHDLHKPLIARIQGPVLAGALLLVCNATHAIAADHVTFSAPEIRKGLWPFQVMAGLFQVMSQREGLDFIMRGHSIDAETARRSGLINRAVPASRLDATVDALAREFRDLDPDAMSQGLAAFRAQQSMTFAQALPYLKDCFFGVLNRVGPAKR